MSRIILKLSGEALAGPKSMGFDENTVRGVAKQVRRSTASRLTRSECLLRS